MNIRDYDPTKGQAFQGDVAIVPVPKGIAISEHDEIKPVAGRLILQEGEVTGHHHAIGSRVAMFRDDAIARAEPVKTADAKLAQHFGALEADDGLDVESKRELASELEAPAGILACFALAALAGGIVLVALCPERRATAMIGPGSFFVRGVF